MIERALLALIIVAGFAAAIALARAWLRRRDQRILERLRANGTGREGDLEDRPRIVYFTTETCVVCRAQQEPALDRLRERVPALRLEQHDAVAEGALAREYGVLSVPTTAVYASDGELVAVNRGYAPAAVLLAQIERRDPVFEAGAAMASDHLGPPRAD